MISLRVILLGRDMFTHTCAATTFRPRFKASSVSPHFRGNIALKASQHFERILNDQDFLILHDVSTLDFS